MVNTQFLSKYVDINDGNYGVMVYKFEHWIKLFSVRIMPREPIFTNGGVMIFEIYDVVHSSLGLPGNVGQLIFDRDYYTTGGYVNSLKTYLWYHGVEIRKGIVCVGINNNSTRNLRISSIIEFKIDLSKFVGKPLV